MELIIAKIKRIVKGNIGDILLSLLIILITVSSFRFGQIYDKDNVKTPVVFKEAPEGYAKIPVLGSKPQKDDKNSHYSGISRSLDNEQVFASKKSKNKYFHYKNCPSFKQLSQANLLTFSNYKEAQSKGYSQAPNCNP